MMRPAPAETNGRGKPRRPAALTGAVLPALLGGLAAMIARPAPAESPAEWTVLAYLGGGAGAAGVREAYLRALGAAPACAAVQIATQAEGGPAGVERIVWAARPGAAHREALRTGWRRQGDMGDPETLQEFALWGLERLPARRYLLLLMGHGRGIRPLTGEPEEAPPRGGVVGDESGGQALTAAELGRVCRRVAAAAPGGRLGLLAADACFSATAELACEVAPGVECLTGSPGLLYEPGVPWDEVLTRLSRRPDVASVVVARMAVEAVRARQQRGGTPRGTYLAADLTRAARLETALAALAQELRRNVKETAPLVTLARSQTPTTGLHAEMLDLSRFLRRLAAETGEGGPVRELAAAAEAEAEAMLLARFDGEAHGGESGRGWSVFFPPNLTGFPADYLESNDFARSAGWGAFLQEYLAHLEDLVTPTAQGVEAGGAGAS